MFELRYEGNSGFFEAQGKRDCLPGIEMGCRNAKTWKMERSI